MATFEKVFGRNGDMNETLSDGRPIVRRTPSQPCVECGHFTPWQLASFPGPRICSTECLADYDGKPPTAAAPATGDPVNGFRPTHECEFCGGPLGADMACERCDPTDDPVNAPSRHAAIDIPSYYDHAIKPHEAAEAWGLDRDAYLFNVLKYIIRAGKKESEPAIKDLRKARDYINLRIAQIEREANG